MASAGRRAPARDYYDVLELPHDASDEDVRRAYRKIALVWHPDKNLHRPEEAHTRFQEIQNAYAVLSDRAERAWYDTHKDAILRGGSSDDGGEGQLINLFSYFTPSAFGEYDDSPTGFYTVYRKLFEQLAAEEQRFAGEGFHPADFSFPRFGSADFYEFWGMYTSRMSFAWADEHNPNEAPNRYVRRAMEKENKKVRDAARRERSDEIRALANFVKRRDKRYMTAALDAKRKADEEVVARKRAAEARASAASAAAAERSEYISREAEVYHAEMRAMSGYRLADEDDGRGRKGKKGVPVAKRAVITAAVATETPVGEVSGEATAVGADAGAAEQSDEGDEEDAEDVFWCDVCAKDFRTAGQLQNHERSKKHLAAVIAAELQAQEEAAEEDDDAAVDTPAAERDGAAAETGEAEEDEDADAHLPLEVLLGSPAHAQRDADKSSSSSSSSSDSDDEDDDVDIAARFARMRVGRKAAPSSTPVAPASHVSSDEEADAPDDAAAPAIATAVDAAAPPAAAVADAGVAVDAADEPATKAKKRRRAAKPAASAAVMPASGISGEAQFRPKEDASLLAGGSKGVPIQAKANAAGVAAMLEREHCGVCGQDFPTRNKLFAHIKKTGHAMVKTVGAPAVVARGDKSRVVEEDDDDDAGRGRRKGKRR